MAGQLHMEWIFGVLSQYGISYADLVPLLDASGRPTSLQRWTEFLWGRAQIEIVFVALTGATNIYKSDNDARTLIGVWEKPVVLVKQDSWSKTDQFLLVRHS